MMIVAFKKKAGSRLVKPALRGVAALNIDWMMRVRSGMPSRLLFLSIIKKDMAPAIKMIIVVARTSFVFRSKRCAFLSPADGFPESRLPRRLSCRATASFMFTRFGKPIPPAKISTDITMYMF